jgi:hypothetical protein
VPQHDIPLAAHFLILADAFDAMTTDKPFRKRMTRERALEEIERGSGTQFHPVIARAFIAVQRGEDPTAVVRGDELTAVREASALSPSTARDPVDLFGRPDLIALAGGGACLVALGLEQPIVAAVGAVAALVGLTVWQRTRKRVSRLTGTLESAWKVQSDQAHIFGRLVDAVGQAWPLGYAAFVEWTEDGAGGSIKLERGDQRPPEPSLISWLLREAESGAEIAVDEGGELPGAGHVVALPLRRDNSALVGFIVLCGLEQPPGHLLPALACSVDMLGLAFADAKPNVVLLPSRGPAATSLDAGLDGQPRTLEA